MAALVEIILVILRALFPAIKSAAEDRAEDAVGRPELVRALRRKIKATWFRVVIPAAVLLLPLSGCFSTTIYVPDGEPVRVRTTIKNARVWVMTKDGERATRMDIPAGWYCLPMPDEEAK